MIRVNDDFAFERYESGWKLHWFRPSVNPKTKLPTRSESVLYYSNMEQVCKAILDRAAYEVPDIASLLERLESYRTDLLQAINKGG